MHATHLPPSWADPGPSQGEALLCPTAPAHYHFSRVASEIGGDQERAVRAAAAGGSTRERLSRRCGGGQGLGPWRWRRRRRPSARWLQTSGQGAAAAASQAAFERGGGRRPGCCTLCPAAPPQPLGGQECRAPRRPLAVCSLPRALRSPPASLHRTTAIPSLTTGGTAVRTSGPASGHTTTRGSCVTPARGVGLHYYRGALPAGPSSSPGSCPYAGLCSSTSSYTPRWRWPGQCPWCRTAGPSV